MSWSMYKGNSVAMALVKSYQCMPTPTVALTVTASLPGRKVAKTEIGAILFTETAREGQLRFSCS